MGVVVSRTRILFLALADSFFFFQACLAAAGHQEEVVVYSPAIAPNEPVSLTRLVSRGRTWRSPRRRTRWCCCYPRAASPCRCLRRQGQGPSPGHQKSRAWRGGLWREENIHRGSRRRLRRQGQNRVPRVESLPEQIGCWYSRWTRRDLRLPRSESLVFGCRKRD